MKRLFVSGEGSTDDEKIYCGGPDIEDAKRGLMNVLEETIRQILAGETDCDIIELSVVEMTDEQVANLEEC